MGNSNKLTIAFDVDDTLLVPSVARRRLVGGEHDVPNYEVIAILRWFQAQGHVIVIWSAGGVDYAKYWGAKFGLEPFEVRVKQKSDDVDIAFDDCDVDLAKVNIKVKRINNSISREEWNVESKNTELVNPITGR